MTENLHSIFVGSGRRVAALLIAAASLYAMLGLMVGNAFPAALLLLLIILFVLAGTEIFGLCLAFGLVCPFTVPQGVVRDLPAYPFVFMFCAAALFLKVSTDPKRLRLQVCGIAMPILAGYLLIRYLVNPVMPGYAIGLSADISGFRTWANLFMGLATVFVLPSLLQTKEHVFQLLSWLLISSLAFAVLLLAVMPFPDYRVVSFLHASGFNIAFLQNGWLRFVVLPALGEVLLAAAVMPEAFGIRKGKWTWALMAIGIAAVLLGSSRSGWLGAFAIVGAVLVLTRRYTQLLFMALAVVASLLLGMTALSQGWIGLNTPGVRVLSVLDKDVAYATGADNTVEWRYRRWRMAIEDIRQAPLFGKGFGGLEDVMTSYNPYDVSLQHADFNAEVDVASGGTHNGYISLARGVGIPACVLFCWVLGRSIWLSRRCRGAKDERVRAAGVFICAMLVNMAVQFMASLEVHTPKVWLFMGLAVMLARGLPGDEMPASGGNQGSGSS